MIPAQVMVSGPNQDGHPRSNAKFYIRHTFIVQLSPLLARISVQDLVSNNIIRR